MSKKFYITTFLILSLTIILFSVSYSKDSGFVQYNNFEIVNDGIKSIYENNNHYKVYKVSKIDDYENLEMGNINVINTSNKEVSFALQVECLDCLDKVYYSSKEGEKELIKNYVTYLSDLKKYGTDGDSIVLNMRFFSTEEYKDEIKVNIVPVSVDSLGYKILSSNNTYYKDGKYIYYKNDNFIKYNDGIYRIISSSKNKVRIVNFGNVEKYNDEYNYITVDDILNSFNQPNINLDNMNGYDSWIKEEGEFWISNKKYYKDASIVNGNDDILVKSTNILDIDSYLLVNKGDGSRNNPYEVQNEG